MLGFRNILHPIFGLFKRFNRVLVLAEHHNSTLHPKTAKAVTAAKKLKADISILVAGTNIDSVVKALTQTGDVKEIIKVESEVEGLRPEALAPFIVNVIQETKTTHLIAASSFFTIDLIPRVAAKLNCTQISGVAKIKQPDIFVRELHAGNALQTIKVLDNVKIILLKNRYFQADSLKGGEVTVRNVPPGIYKTDLSTSVSFETLPDMPDFATAKVVVVGGSALGPNFLSLFELAKLMKAGVGATKQAVVAGFASSNLEFFIHQGHTFAPDLYIGFGVYGTLQKLIDIKDSKCIVAIHSDEKAPIFNISTYSLVADPFQTVKELTEKLGKNS